MQKRPTSKSLLCGSWVRVDMREVRYFSSDRHGQRGSNHYKQNTIQSTGISHEERQLWGPEAGDRKGTQSVLRFDWFLGQPSTHTCFYTVSFDLTGNLVTYAIIV